jgi:hypothetical protein
LYAISSYHEVYWGRAAHGSIHVQALSRVDKDVPYFVKDTLIRVVINQKIKLTRGWERSAPISNQYIEAGRGGDG